MATHRADPNFHHLRGALTQEGNNRSALLVTDNKDLADFYPQGLEISGTYFALSEYLLSHHVRSFTGIVLALIMELWRQNCQRRPGRSEAPYSGRVPQPI